jgi:hypothetical protein
MLLDFNSDLKDLDGNAMNDANIGKLLASTLAQATEVDAIKFLDWALKLHAGKPLDIDLSDVETLRSFIKNHRGLTVLLKGQLEAVFNQKQ